MSLDNQDYHFMARAIQLAKKGQYTTHPNPRVGCIISKDNKIIGEGYHHRAGEAHAEVNALSACKQFSHGATAYVTLEPCSHTGKTPPCANALIEAQLNRVVIAMKDPNPLVAGRGIKRLKEAGIKVDVGVLEEQARSLNSGFIKRMEKGLPWVRVKLAMSLDGRTAMASGESQWITGNEARQDVQKLRASADAVLTGVGTVLADNPSLNVRLSASELGIRDEIIKQAKRIILDTELKTPLDAKLLSLEGETIIVTASQDEMLIRAFRALGVNIIEMEKDESNHLPLEDILSQLAQQEINEIHVEAGATLCGALIQKKLVDEIILYVAPIFMGSDAKGLLNLSGLEFMKDKIELSIKDVRAIGNDLRLSVCHTRATQ